MPEQRDDKVFEIVRRLASYVEANPRACDTWTGIACWWLHADIEEIEPLQQALEWMKDHGLMEEAVAADGRLRYRRIGTPEQFAVALASLDGEGGAL